MSWINTKIKKTGKIPSHEAYINMEYVIYVSRAEDGNADFYLSSENWLCSSDNYDDIIANLEDLSQEE